MTPPIVFVHTKSGVSPYMDVLTLRNSSLSQSSIDSTLCSYRVTSCRKQFRNAGSVESCLCQTKSCSEASTASTNNQRIVLVIYDWVFITTTG